MTQLRDYQSRDIARIRDAWRDGAANVLYVLPTGGGKTVTLASLVHAGGEPACVIAHRQELVSQLSLALARERLRHGIVAPPAVVRDIVKLHIEEIGASYYDPNALTRVAGVDTLIRMPAGDPWLQRVRLWVQDEAHHVQESNKWGKAAAMMPNARGLMVTATPCRADRKGLGRGHGGIADAMIEGPQMQELMDRGFLVPRYDVYCPPSDVDYSSVRASASGDLSLPGLRAAVHKSSKIVGDVVDAYLQHAAGLRGITFAVDVESATEIADRFKSRGVPAAVIHGAMPDLERAKLMRAFKAGQLLQLTNCDLLGEGVDVPAVEVVSMARKTLSYSLYAQQFGRMMRAAPGKVRGMLIDHVGNLTHHKPPNKPRLWTLEGGETRAKRPADNVPMRVCPMCTVPCERYYPACPNCGAEFAPAGRSKPEEVDGDLFLLDPDVLAAMCREVDPPLRLPVGAGREIVGRLTRLHQERAHAQHSLRLAMAQWGGQETAAGLSVREAQRKFFHVHGVDVMSAQALGAREAGELERKLRGEP